jgi:apyrase
MGLSRRRRKQEEVFEAIKPGFRAFATDPQAAARSLEPLLRVVHNHVPEAVRATTPMTLRATAGIRLLPEGPQAAQAIMQAVTAKLKASGLYVHDDYVSVLSGV